MTIGIGKLLTLSLLLSGCALPDRAGCIAGNVQYSILLKAPTGQFVACNDWKEGQKGYKAELRLEDGELQKASCEPIYGVNDGD